MVVDSSPNFFHKRDVTPHVIGMQEVSWHVALNSSVQQVQAFRHFYCVCHANENSRILFLQSPERSECLRRDGVINCGDTEYTLCIIQ